MPDGAGLAYQALVCEILTHFYVTNIPLAQKMTKLQHLIKISQDEQFTLEMLNGHVTSFSNTQLSSPH